MNSFYYYSRTKLKLVEIKGVYKKFLALFIMMVSLVSSILFGGYFLISAAWGADTHLSSLEEENRELSSKISELLSLYEKLNSSVDSLSKVNNDLRLAADLPPVDIIDRRFGTGGGAFDDILNLSKRHSKVDLNGLAGFIEVIQNKIALEKANYYEISKKLKNNELLYACIPAIKPAEGVLARSGYGMRVHPILKIKRMHEGVDIVTEIGTPVIAPGNGVISFVGEKGGFGLCVEIDHGFGYRTVMGHLSESGVRIGENVKRGMIIGKTGNSGLSTGPHLHYEVHHNGIALDPEGFMFDNFKLFDLIAKK